MQAGSSGCARTVGARSALQEILRREGGGSPDWVIPPEASARFVWRMEEVLDLSEEPYDEKRPVVCFDERPRQLLADLREPLGIGAGRPERRDHE